MCRINMSPDVSTDDISLAPEISSKKLQDRRNIGLILAGSLGVAGLAIVGLAAPFLLPALRRHCLPYVPATDTQLENIARALRQHAKKRGTFLDIGSGDGRVCRLGARLNVFTEVHGVELNYPLVLYSRLKKYINFKKSSNIKYYHRDLWTFPLNKYDTLCVFGVESMMSPLEENLKRSNEKDQIVCACRFPFGGLKQVDQIGDGIDTVWVYHLNTVTKNSDRT